MGCRINSISRVTKAYTIGGVWVFLSVFAVSEHSESGRGPICHRHRRMRRGAGGAAAPPSFWATQFFGQRRSFFWAAAMVGGGCFSIFRRADDVTRTMSKGGGGACEIPPFRKSCIRACYLCKILGNQPLRPPPLTKAFPYAYGHR